MSWVISGWSFHGMYCPSWSGKCSCLESSVTYFYASSIPRDAVRNINLWGQRTWLIFIVLLRSVKASHILISVDGKVYLSGLRSNLSMINHGQRLKVVHDFPKYSIKVLPWLSPEVLQQVCLKTSYCLFSVICCICITSWGFRVCSGKDKTNSHSVAFAADEHLNSVLFTLELPKATGQSCMWVVWFLLKSFVFVLLHSKSWALPVCIASLPFLFPFSSRIFRDMMQNLTFTA